MEELDIEVEQMMSPPAAPDEHLVAPIVDDAMAASSSGQPASLSNWQLLSVSLHRTAQLGFGIAVSGGRDNAHFTSGDPAVVISDVVEAGPAWGLLQLHDRILSANGVSFENIDYARAVDVIKGADQINMIVKRRVAMPVLEFEQRTLKFTLTKSRKKDDFGIVLGCKFYIKEIRNPKLAEKDPGLREGDSVLRINGQSIEGATLEECEKWLERSRDKLCLVIQRDVRRGGAGAGGAGGSRWPSQNTVYERVGSVGATPRHSPSPAHMMMAGGGTQGGHQPLSARSSHDYINSPRWSGSAQGGAETPEEMHRRRVSSPAMHSASGSMIGGVGGVGGGGLNGQQLMQQSGHAEYEYYQRGQARAPEDRVRTVVFRKVGGSVGVRVVGGNEVGVFVSAVAGDSPAALHGVCCGDRILEVNGRSMRGVTREAAVQLLLSLEDRVALRLEHAPAEFEQVRNNQLGDNFYIRAHFSREKKGGPLELSIQEGDIFLVTDTLFGGTVGLWQASRVYSASGKPEPAKGVIPNQTTAEGLAREQRRVAEQKGGGRGTLLRRKLEQRRTKSLGKCPPADPAELAAALPLPAYERVALNTPTFHRPVVLFGPLADVARKQLLQQFALRFGEPAGEGVIRLREVDAVIATGKHAVLDISIESVERLQLAQYAPIVVLIDVEGRSRIREVRKKAAAPHLSSRQLADQSATIKKHHAHLLSATVDASHEEGWFDALRDLIAHLQQRRLWMPEFPPNLPLEDVLLFPLSSSGHRLSGMDSDRESVGKGDYGDYSAPPPLNRPQLNDQMTRSIYDYDGRGDLNAAADIRSRFASLPRRVQHGVYQQSPDVSRMDSPVTGRSSQMSGQLIANHSAGHAPSGHAPLMASQSDSRTDSSLDQRSGMNGVNGVNGAGKQPMPQPTSPGYFNVKQLLDDPSSVTAELDNLRLLEQQQIQSPHQPHQPLQPPSSDMYNTNRDNAFDRERSRLDASPRLSAPGNGLGGRPQLAPKPVGLDGGGRDRWIKNLTPDPPSSPSLASQSHSVNLSSRISPLVRPAPANHEVLQQQYHMPSQHISLDIRSPPRENGAAQHTAPMAEEEKEEEQREPEVVEQTSAVVGPAGGVLSCPASGVELRIPPGAVHKEQEIYVKVCREDSSSPPIDKSKGETLLSPLVMCGPQGLSFAVPLELRLPHRADDAGGDWAFSLKTGEAGEWRQLALDSSNAQSDPHTLVVPIHKF